MFNKVNETNMVYCAGCSFTWGQNLWFYDWVRDNKFKDDDYTNDPDSHELFQWTDQRFFVNDEDYTTMYKLRYSNLLRKQLPDNWGVVNLMSGNGGDNTSTMRNYLSDLQYVRKNLKNKLIFVLQLTHSLRDYKDPHNHYLEHSLERDHLIKTHLKVNDLYKELKKQYIDLIVWSYPSDLGWLMRKEPYFCKIKIKDDFYDSFEESQFYSSYKEIVGYDGSFHESLNKQNFTSKHDVPISIGEDLGFGNDLHPSKEFHQLMANSIWYKMNELNLI